MDLANVKPLNLDNLIGNPKVHKRVKLIGVELEGGWIKLPPGVALEHDGSVFQGRIPPGVNHIGELPIGPVNPEAIGKLLKGNYPPKINSTCGMHVHMSFEKLFYYHLLMVPEYQETILHYLTQWAHEMELPENHSIWARLRGESRFCQKKFWPDAQAGTKQKGHNQNTPGHRYTVIHYCGRNAVPTIECRVLPMLAKSTHALQAIQRVVDITNSCIHALGKDAKRTTAGEKITLPDGMVYEETIIDSL